jgi:hypothetical protein
MPTKWSHLVANSLRWVSHTVWQCHWHLHTLLCLTRCPTVGSSVHRRSDGDGKTGRTAVSSPFRELTCSLASLRRLTGSWGCLL